MSASLLLLLFPNIPGGAQRGAEPPKRTFGQISAPAPGTRP